MKTKSDSELRHDVERELEWDPSIDERRIAVTAVDGVVTLQGEVSTYAEKWRAERAAERVAGVRAIANDLVVKTATEPNDTDIAKAVADALERCVVLPADKITVKVQNGFVTLTGEVDWDYQRRAAERSIRDLAGVRGIMNLITIRPRVEPHKVKERIEETFKRGATLDAQNIEVEANGSEVTLRGTVRTWLERREAEKAAWSAPGITKVNNLITVKTPVAV
jgi:osmotically-inducible protein OsmY